MCEKDEHSFRVVFFRWWIFFLMIRRSRSFALGVESVDIGLACMPNHFHRPFGSCSLVSFIYNVTDLYFSRWVGEMVGRYLCCEDDRRYDQNQKKEEKSRDLFSAFNLILNQIHLFQFVFWSLLIFTRSINFPSACVLIFK